MQVNEEIDALSTMGFEPVNFLVVPKVIAYQLHRVAHRLIEVETIDRPEFEALVALKTPLVQIRGQWVSLDPEQVEAAIRFWERHTSEGEVGLLDAVRLGLGAETAAGSLPVERIDAEGPLAAWLARLSGAAVTVLAVVPHGPPRSPSDDEDDLATLLTTGSTVVGQAARHLVQAGIPATLRLRQGSLAHQLHHEVIGTDYDLVLIGSKPILTLGEKGV